MACIINLLRSLMTTLVSSISLKLQLLMTLELSFIIITCLYRLRDRELAEVEIVGLR